MDERKQTESRVLKIREERMGNQPEGTEERPKERKDLRSTEEATVRRKREDRGKEETEAE